jgi:acetylornithine deacetylase/succinyl-diaminopimelate desuccinylase-like protein
MTALLLSAWIALASAPAPAPRPPFDVVGTLREYIKIDTSNPPGNELKAAEFLRAILAGEGIEAEIVEIAPGRANLVARLRGNGTRKALILSHHMDVVHADRAGWSADPFGAEIRDGYLYGRGALDMKTTGILHLAALIRLKRERVPLDRDVIYIGTADEEVGAEGMSALIAKRPELFAGAAESLTEGDVIDARGGGGVRAWNVSVAEKAVLWLELTATGIAGHASTPPPAGTAVDALVGALDRLRRHETPIVVLPEVARYFAALKDRFPGLAPEKLARLESSLAEDPAFRAAFLGDGERAARVRNTIAITVLRGGPQTNVIPKTASAQVDCRLLPGQDPEAMIEEVRRAIDDPRIAIRTLQPVVKSTASATSTPLFRAIERVAAREAPGVPVVPTLLTSWTESALLRPLGIDAYGFDPLALDERELALSHGDDERVSLASVERGAAIVYAIVKEAASR